MCGIVGFVDRHKQKEKKEIIKEMADMIKHRGPDAEGYYVDSFVALGHRRLSIIDLSKSGSQPIYNEDKTMAIVFNGEIYNYESLKEDLIKKGHIFKTKTDTEVLIHGYEEYKEKFEKMGYTVKPYNENNMDGFILETSIDNIDNISTSFFHVYAECLHLLFMIKKGKN